MVLYPWMTGNFIKHKISKRCKIKCQCDTNYGRPRFIYNQVDAYLNNPKPRRLLQRRT